MRNVLEDMQMCCGTTCNKVANIEYVKQLEYLLAISCMQVHGVAVAADGDKLGMSTLEAAVLIDKITFEYFPEHFK